MGGGGVHWQGLENDRSPPTSADVKNGRAIPPLLHEFLEKCLIIKHRDFTLRTYMAENVR
jgi:hypothetical protein